MSGFSSWMYWTDACLGVPSADRNCMRTGCGGAKKKKFSKLISLSGRSLTYQLEQAAPKSTFGSGLSRKSFRCSTTTATRTQNCCQSRHLLALSESVGSLGWLSEAFCLHSALSCKAHFVWSCKAVYSRWELRCKSELCCTASYPSIDESPGCQAARPIHSAESTRAARRWSSTDTPESQNWSVDMQREIILEF